MLSIENPMLYITTIKNLEIPGTAEEGSSIVVFCKGNETIKVTELKSLLDTVADKQVKVSFEPSDSREDMLMRVGELLGSAETCTFLDASLPIPKRYADKVISAAKKPKKRTRKAKEPAKTKEVERKEEKPTDPVPTAKKADEKKPPEKQAGKGKKKWIFPEPPAEEMKDPDAKALFDLVKVHSADIGYSWKDEMLYLNLLTTIQSNLNDPEALEGAIKAIGFDELLWKHVEPVLDQAKEIAKKCSGGIEEESKKAPELDMNPPEESETELPFI